MIIPPAALSRLSPVLAAHPVNHCLPSVEWKFYFEALYFDSEVPLAVLHLRSQSLLFDVGGSGGGGLERGFRLPLLGYTQRTVDPAGHV